MEQQQVAPALGELTRRQVAVTFGQRGSRPLPASYDTYRKIRKHPTVALARAVAVAPIVAAEWSVESDDGVPDEWVGMVKDQFLPIRQPLIEAAVLGGIDFGYQGFEKVFRHEAGLFKIGKFKPLLQDITEIQIVQDTGAFAGFKQNDVELPVEKSLLFSFRVEGTQWHGEPLLENARETYNQWYDANAGASRYDRKVAGSHFIVYYPEGKCRDQNGSEVDNAEMARTILAGLESSGSVAIPDDVARYVEGLNTDHHGWRIELLSDGTGRQPTFIDRLRYLDTMLCRAVLVPERAVLEGQHGTLAEAGTHADFALTSAELTHQYVTRIVNWHAVDQVLALNFGEEAMGKVRLAASPLVDTKLEFLRQVYTAVLTNPNGFLEEFGLIDTDALKDSLGVPRSEEVASANDEGEEATTLTVPGVDAGSPMAATIRRLYRSIR